MGRTPDLGIPWHGEMVPIRFDQPPRIITAVVRSFHDEFRKSPISSRQQSAMQLEFGAMLRLV